MDWVQIGSAVFIGAMILYLLPRAKDMINNTPKGDKKDWMGFVIPAALVVLFVIFLISFVR